LGKAGETVWKKPKGGGGGWKGTDKFNRPEIQKLLVVGKWEGCFFGPQINRCGEKEEKSQADKLETP